MTDFSDELAYDAVPDVVVVLSSVLIVLHRPHDVRKADMFRDHLGQVGTVAYVYLVTSWRRGQHIKVTSRSWEDADAKVNRSRLRQGDNVGTVAYVYLVTSWRHWRQGQHAKVASR